MRFCTHCTQIVLLTSFFVVTLALNLLKGGGGFASPLGVTCGSGAFWGITAATLVSNLSFMHASAHCDTM